MREATECAWGMFLDTLICRLGDVQDGEALALVAPSGRDGWSTQLVIRADRDRGWMWVTRGISGSTAAEEVVARVGESGAFELAQAIVRAAREDLRLPHPQLFTARADGPGAARLAESLGLAVAGTVGEPTSGGGEPARGGPETLRPMVERVIREVFGQEPGVDDDGDLTFDLAGTTAFVLFRADGGMIEAWSMVVRGVYSRRNTAVELDLLNRRGAWSTWYMRDRNVFQKIMLPARPLSAENLEGMLRAFAQDFRQNRDELAYRLGGMAA
ncbi:T3SS (YopN, CesT) and YbjN peptide-binding chaperone 1 [Dietzia sp. UBA5065]|uniref:T3SS (YopN, CesT) and YbjN peptide-binding chaperone 1 n=1 Tax=Dietzia sp. UBA5065 TaxID=1946422 RepID=UPI0025B7FDB2|nr:hypothetical protein [Dietzia sp. UBA5065]